MDQQVCGDGLSSAEAAALVVLLQHPAQSIRQLSMILRVTHSGAVRIVDRLEAAGWASRQPSGRGRTLAVGLSPSGKRRARRVLAQRHQAMQELVAGLDEYEVAGLEEIAGRLLAALTDDRQSARRLCRLCDEELCVQGARCPVDEAVVS